MKKMIAAATAYAKSKKDDNAKMVYEKAKKAFEYVQSQKAKRTIL